MLRPYNRQKAVEYARKWALSSNPNFYHFGGIGGDCTNFISQCLYAGSGVMNNDYIKGWYYYSIAQRSPSWTSVGYLFKYLTRINGVGPMAEVVNRAQVEAGDLVQLRQNNSHFNHTLIITEILNGEIYVCAHSDDALDRKLSSYSYKEIMFLHIKGVNY